MIVTLCQRKGGAGKTTIAASLAAVMSSGAFRQVTSGITVDVDGQGSFTRWAMGLESARSIIRSQSVAALEWPVNKLNFELDNPMRKPGITPAELVALAAPDCLRPSLLPGVSHVGLNPRVYAAGIGMVLLQELGTNIIVDCPPDFETKMARAAILQSDFVLCPVVPEPWAVDGCELVLGAIRSLDRDELIDTGRVLFVINQRQRCGLHDAYEKALRKRFGKMISSVVIPRNISVAEASESVHRLKPKSILFEAGKKLFCEMEKIAKNSKKKAA